MALIELGNIIINDAASFGTGSNGDEYKTYFNDTTLAVEVELNGSPLSSGDAGAVPMFQSDQDNGFITVTDRRRYQYCDGNDLIIFAFSEEFPYWPPTRVLNSPACQITVCNIAKSGNPVITNATNNTTADGSVTLSAYSTRTIKWWDSDFNYSETGYVGTTVNNISTYTFSGLFPGSYVFYAKDSAGCSISIDVIIESDRLANDYSEKYNYQFIDREGDKYKVSFLLLDYTGSTTAITNSASIPITRTYGQMSKNDKFQPVKGCALNASIMAETAKEYIDDFKIF